MATLKIRIILGVALALAGRAFAAEPGDGSAHKHARVLAADYSTKKIAVVDPATLKAEWSYSVGGIHDLHRLPDGNILFQTSMTRVVEIDPQSNKVRWEYDAAKMNGNEGRNVEVHAFQRLPDGLTLIAESGPGRLIEVNGAGRIMREIKLKVNKPDPHRDTRLVRKLDSGNYLVSHEGDGVVREYDKEGAVVWEYEIPLFGKQPADGHGPEAFGNSVFSALRLPNGNTLIGTGNGHSVIEVTPEKKIVWEVHQKDLPGITFAWVTTLEVHPDGNIVIGNCHAGPDNPQLVEITRDKKVVWTFKDFKNFGDAMSNSQVLDAPEGTIR